MAHSVPMPKNSSVQNSTASTVFTTATRSKNPQASASRHNSPPVTAKGIRIMASPERVLVMNRQVRSTGRVCISPTDRAL